MLILLKKDNCSSLVKFDEAMKQTIDMASAAYKNDEIVGVQQA